MSLFSRVSHKVDQYAVAKDIEGKLVVGGLYGDLEYKGPGFAVFCDPPALSSHTPKITYYAFVRTSDKKVLRFTPEKVRDLLRKIDTGS